MTGELHEEWPDMRTSDTHDDQQPTIEEPAGLIPKTISDAERSFEERIAALERRQNALIDAVDTIFARLEALEAKPKGNRQGYPREGVVWDGQVRLMAKAYGYGNAEIDDMQEAMDIYFLALVGTSKARVSSDWQLNARTWIKNDAKRHGRERQDGPGAPLAEDVPDPSPEVMQALRDVLVEPDELERDRKARLIWRAYPYPNTIMQACNLWHSPWWDQHHNRKGMIEQHRGFIEHKAAKLGIPAGAFAWPAV